MILLNLVLPKLSVNFYLRSILRMLILGEQIYHAEMRDSYRCH